MRVVMVFSAAVLVVVFATWAYRVNYAAQAALDRVAELQALILAEREAISVLEAEWAYLNRPDRLRALVGLHHDALGLVPLVPEQFGETATVAFPPEDQDPLAIRGDAQ